RAQVDGVSHTALPFRQIHTAEVYQGVAGASETVGAGASQVMWKNSFEHADTGPMQIVLKIPPPSNGKQWAAGKQMELVIDEAGKVRFARIMTPLLDKDAVPQLSTLDQDWLAAAAGWKYIPAYKLGRPRAFR
ncbi:MAG TPA: hypothetical protein VF126_11600, partial [Acidobacteriaceae bacterium]